MKIAFFSFADIDNFGDVLFSHVFKMEMEKRIPHLHIDFYCPTEYHAEGFDYIAYSREKVVKKYDALIVFGGEVIHLYDTKTWKPIYSKNGKKVESLRPSDTIFDWVDIPGAYKAWISVGVRPIENHEDYQKISDAVNHLDYVSVRGALSKKILENMQLQYNHPQIEITPDLGWKFPSLLENVHEKGKYYRKHVHSDEYLIFQINSITEAEAKEIGSYLKEFKYRNNVEVYLLPVIRPWEDVKYLELINKQTGNCFPILSNELGGLEILDIICHAQYVLCGSLHTAITALAVGIPAAIINKWQGTKLQDIFGQQYRLHMVRHNFSEIPYLLNQLVRERACGKSELLEYAKFVNSKLNAIFDHLAEQINRGVLQ